MRDEDKTIALSVASRFNDTIGNDAVATAVPFHEEIIVGTGIFRL